MKGVGGQKKPNLVNIVCERPLMRTSLFSVIFQIYLAYGIFMYKFLPYSNFLAVFGPNIAVAEKLT